MTNISDNQTLLARFYGRLQADWLKKESPDQSFEVQMSEHGVRVVNTASGKTEYSNSIYTCAQLATPIRNRVVYEVAEAMKKIALARQAASQNGRLNQRWTEFAASASPIPSNDEIVHFVNILKKEGALSKTGIDEIARFITAFAIVQEDNNAQESAAFIDALLERFVAAKQQKKLSFAAVEAAQKANRQKAKPLADKFKPVTGKTEPTLPLAEAQKAHEKTTHLFDALNWLATELELVADTTGAAGTLYTGCVRRF
ncbi:MAG: hypothetical protein K2Y22_14265 [Candidatus Obscuribacterales bacterium]|nr:hypothetical protein [Candidatus Obscuribacterales bacterium]